MGPIEVWAAGRQIALGGGRQMKLLAFLLLNANRAVSADAVIDGVWGPERDGAAKRLQMGVMRLRRALSQLDGRDGPRVRTVHGGYLMAVEPGELDAAVFADLLGDGSRALAAGDPAGASELQRRALALWRGPALAEVAFEGFAQPEIRRLEELRLSALEGRIEADLQLGRHAELIGELEALLATNPTREGLAGQMMLALYRAGRQADALAVYNAIRRELAEQLGLEPGPALNDLQAEILRHAPTLRLPSAQPSAPDRSDRTKDRDAVSGIGFTDGLLPLPDGLLATERGAFVGREADLDRLQRVYGEVIAKARRIVLICGEPGIGKTRLCTEIAARVQAAGAAVLYGQCDEIALLPYQPFVEAVRHYVSVSPAEELAEQVSLVSGELRRIVPELAERVPALSLPLSGDPDGARFRLFDAVGSLLVEAAQRRPLVLVLDDLHWADTPTLMLFKYLARYPGHAGMLVLGTYRDTEVDAGHPLFDALADLRREHRIERYALAPLDAAAVARLTEFHGGAGAQSPELAKIVYEGTEGNPFFVVEVLRNLAEGGGANGMDRHGASSLADGRLEVPEGVKDVVATRLERLRLETNEALVVASVLGRDFELAIIARVSEIPEPQVLDFLEEAVRARVIEEAVGSPGRYSFSHILIRETMYGGLTVTRRALLHRRVALGLEDAYADDLGPHHAELAHHFALAGTPDDLDRAINHGTAAGERATALLAHEQAAAHFRRAVELLDEVGPEGSEARRCQLVIAQGEAERQAGDPAYRETLLEGGRLAQERRDSELLARAALANSRGLFSSAHEIDDERVSVLQAALAAFASDDSSTRALLLALLAVELLAGHDWRYRSKLSDEALAIARRLDDPRTLALVLNQRFVALWGPRTLNERETNTDEAKRLADQLDDPLLAFYAAAFAAHAAMERGDLLRSDELLARMSELDQQLGQPIIRWYDAVSRAKRCSITAPPADAEKRAVMALKIGQRAAQPDAVAWSVSQAFVARFLGDTLDRGEPSLVQLFDTPGLALSSGKPFSEGRTVARQTEAMKSVTFRAAGRVDDARRHLDALMADRLEDLPHDYAALLIPAVAAHACARLGDRPAAVRLHSLLERHSDEFVDGGPVWFGAANHHLAVLAATLERVDEAEYRFGMAVSAYQRLNARAWLARAQIDWAEALLSRDSVAATRRGREMLGRVIDAAEELNAEHLADRASSMLSASPRELRHRSG